MDWTYGRRVVLELLNSPTLPSKILISETADQNGVQEIVTLARKKNIPIEKNPRHILDKLCGEHHQGVAAQIARPETHDLKTFLKTRAAGNQYLLLLDEIQDPHNLGAIARSALCLGASALILPTRRSAEVTPAAVKASSGALHHLPTIEIANLGVAVERLKESGYTVYGADASGTPLDKVQFQFPLAVVMGNEQNGIRPHLKKNCDQLIAVPQSQIVTSLNVSNAAAIILYEIQRQAGKEEGKGMRDEG